MANNQGGGSLLDKIGGVLVDYFTAVLVGALVVITLFLGAGIANNTTFNNLVTNFTRPIISVIGNTGSVLVLILLISGVAGIVLKRSGGGVSL